MNKSKGYLMFRLPIVMVLSLVSVMAFSALGESSGNKGTLTASKFHSPTLDEYINYNVYLPYGYAGSNKYPVIYMLHGRGDKMSAWTKVVDDMDNLIANGDIPPVIAIMPDAPWCDRGNYYIDSEYKTGKKVETALVHDLTAHVDFAYSTINSRDGRIIAGYSMGGYGAARYLLAHPDIFGSGIVLSPAVYTPFPPIDSSTREFGAFGRGEQKFVDEIWIAKNYPSAILVFEASKLTSKVYIAVGDKEWKNPPPDEMHDLDMEAHLMFNKVCRVKGVTVEFRVMDGGHDWDVWLPAFTDAMKYLFKQPVAKIK